MLPNKRKGVTLLEFLIVIAIISIMAGAIVAMMSSFGRRQPLEISVANLVGDLRQTQQFARVQRDGYRYYGLRFYNNLGEGNNRPGWKILCYCQTNANGNCTGQIPLPITGITTFRIIKSSEMSDNNGNGPELLDNTFFGERVNIDAASDFQIGNSIIFTPEGSATSDGVNLVSDTNGDGTIGIILALNGNNETIEITPLTGHIRIQ